MKHPSIISFTTVNLIPRSKFVKNISQVLRKNSLFLFHVSTEELLVEHNFNTQGSKTVRVELEMYFDSSKPFASQLYLDESFFYLFMFFFFVITSLYLVKK